MGGPNGSHWEDDQQSASTTSNDEDEDSVHGDEEEVVLPEHVDAAPIDMPDWILGKRVTGVIRLGSSSNNYARYRIRCNNPSHGPCGCSLTLGNVPTGLGPRAAEGYFGAWLSASRAPGMTTRLHRKDWRPTKADIKAWLDAIPRP